MLIFISNSNKDQSLVEELIVELGILGYNVQFEPKVLGGSLRWEQIFESIAQADIFIFTVTANTLASHSRWAEYHYALALRKPILAVRLEAVDASTLPPEITRIVDYSSRDQSLRSEFAEALHTLPISEGMEISATPTDVSFLISDLHERIGASNKTAAEKTAILLNLQELIERRETFVATEALFDLFAPSVDPLDPIAREFRDTRKRIQQVNSSPRRRKIALLISGILLLMLVIAIVGFFRGRTPLNSSRSATPLVQIVAALTTTPSELQINTSPEALSIPALSTSTLTISPTMPPSATSTFTPSSTSLPSSTATFTASPTLLPSATPTFTASPTPLPSATPTFTASPTLLPSATPTFTPSPTPLPSATPTFTASPTLLPSSTPTFTASPTPLPSATPTFTASPTSLPSATPTLTSTVDLRAVIPTTTYVGITVEDTAQGVQITKIGTTAIAAGVQVGDSVLAVDLADVRNSEAFYREMNTRNPFARVNLRLRRNSGIVFAIITLGIEDYTAASASP